MREVVLLFLEMRVYIERDSPPSTSTTCKEGKTTEQEKWKLTKKTYV